MHNAVLSSKRQAQKMTLFMYKKGPIGVVYSIQEMIGIRVTCVRQIPPIYCDRKLAVSSKTLYTHEVESCMYCGVCDGVYLGQTPTEIF